MYMNLQKMADKTDKQASSLCFCSAKKTVHVHCACSSCHGKPVNYRTQISHLEFVRNLEAANAVSVAGNFAQIMSLFLFTFVELWSFHPKPRSPGTVSPGLKYHLPTIKVGSKRTKHRTLQDLTSMQKMYLSFFTSAANSTQSKLKVAGKIQDNM